MGAIIVADITKEDSIINAIKWKDQIDDIIMLPNGQPLPKIILANKFDKVEEFEVRGSLDKFMT